MTKMSFSLLSIFYHRIRAILHSQKAFEWILNRIYTSSFYPFSVSLYGGMSSETRNTALSF